MSENIIWKYPKSSCNCYDCDKKNYNNNYIDGIPSNYSIGNCSYNKPNKFDCYDTISFNYNIQPDNSNNGYVNLNPDIGPDLSKDFSEKKCKNGTSKYISRDPRLVDQLRGFTMTLDRPPYNSEVELSDIYKNKYKNYGQNYSDYGSIKSGQVMYYYDKSIQNPFFNPNFTLKSKVNSYLYKDPMDNYKPYYTHDTVEKFNPMNGKREHGCLSFINDTTFHREDILSKQMDLTNRTKYMSRWKL